MFNQQQPLYCNKPFHESEKVYGLALQNNKSQVYCLICYTQFLKKELQNQSQLKTQKYPQNQFLELESIEQLKKQYIEIILRVKDQIFNQAGFQTKLLKNLRDEIERLILEVNNIKVNTFIHLDQELINVEYTDIQQLQDLALFITNKCKYENNELILEKDKIYQDFLREHQQQLNKHFSLNKLSNLQNEFKQTLSTYYYQNCNFNIIMDSIAISDNQEVIALGSQNGEILIYKDKLLKQRYSQNNLRIIKMEIDTQQQYIYVLRQKSQNYYNLYKYGIDENEQNQIDINLKGNYIDFILHKNYIYYISNGNLFFIPNNKIKLDNNSNQNENQSEQISNYENIKSFDSFNLTQLRFLLITDDNKIIYHLDNCGNKIQETIQYQNQKLDDIITIGKFIDPFQFLIGGLFRSLLVYRLKKSSLILKNIIPTDLYCQYLQINNKVLVYSDGFRFQIMDYQNDYKSLEPVASNKQVKSKFWTLLSNGEVVYIIQENDKTSIQRIQS